MCSLSLMLSLNLGFLLNQQVYCLSLMLSIQVSFSIYHLFHLSDLNRDLQYYAESNMAGTRTVHICCHG